ncbi:unnamed protein product [Trichobilharzia szidati]|nr:unnamed protein product [Trichobilharzia szidati]
MLDIRFDYNKYMNSDEFWKMIFIEADSDHNGRISFNEFKRYMDKYSYALGKKEVERAFKFCDLDKSGYIEYNEFKKYMRCEL